MIYIYRKLILAVGISLIFLVTIGIDNYTNWRFIASLIGFIGFAILAWFDYRIRKVRSRK